MGWATRRYDKRRPHPVRRATKSGNGGLRRQGSSFHTELPWIFERCRHPRIGALSFPGDSAQKDNDSMAMFDEIVFAPEVCRTLDAPLVPTHVYQTKDLLDDDWYLQDVRRYFVGRDGLLYRMDTIGAHRDGDRIAYEKHA